MHSLGIVSNCWRFQLAHGETLEALIEQAASEGFDCVELRQTCLGRFESSPEHLPIATALAELPARFPNVRLSLALAVPFLDQATPEATALFAAGVAAAQALAGRFQPHLRLVDLATSVERLAAMPQAETATRVVRLAQDVVGRGGCLSLENAGQPWEWFISVFRAARRQMGTDARGLKLCYDACNLLGASDRPDPAQVVLQLRADELAMVHFKQQTEGAMQPTVCAGRIDWPGQIAALKQCGYDGPMLFEIPPHEQIWAYLRASREFLFGS